LEHFLAAASRAEFPDLHIVREDVLGGMPLVLSNPVDIPIQSDPVIFHEI
jgi:hypothetical protein